MRILIVESDLPILKQLSYALSKELNRYLADLKNDIMQDESLDDIDITELKEFEQLFGQYLRTPIDGSSLSKSDFKDLLTTQLLPAKIVGIASVQIAIAKALGYSDWGDLQAKATHGHQGAKSEIDRLYGEFELERFTRLIFEQFNFLNIELFALKKFLFETLQSIHSPTSFQFSHNRHLLVFGGSSDLIELVLDRRIQAARNKNHQVRILTTYSKGHPRYAALTKLSLNSDEIMVHKRSYFMSACKKLITSRLVTIDDVSQIDPKQTDHLHIVIPDGLDFATDQVMLAIFSQSRMFNCSVSMGIQYTDEDENKGLEVVMDNAFDVVCTHGTSDIIREKFGVSESIKSDEATHHVGWLARTARKVKLAFK